MPIYVDPLNMLMLKYVYEGNLNVLFKRSYVNVCRNIKNSVCAHKGP